MIQKDNNFSNTTQRHDTIDDLIQKDNNFSIVADQAMRQQDTDNTQSNVSETPREKKVKF